MHACMIRMNMLRVHVHHTSNNTLYIHVHVVSCIIMYKSMAVPNILKQNIMELSKAVQLLVSQ